jgi:N-acetylglucosaminyl-diphospho-decaprenol L-rhamnosyltransferase
MVDVAIVVVHWNVATYLDGCLQSIAREQAGTRLRIETLVVDMASPDPAYLEVVERAGVRLLQLPENRGYAAGCNAGIAATAESAVLLLNADVEVLPGAIDSLWQALHVATHVGMTAPLLLNPDGSVQSAGYRFPGVANVVCDLFPVPQRVIESPLNGRLPVGDGAQPLRADYALGAALLLRRSALEQVGGFDEGYGMYSEEIDLARRLAKHHWTTLLVPRARMVHFGGRSTAQRPVAMHEALWRSRARYLARWESPRRQRVIGTVARLGLWLDARGADDQRRAANARLQRAFARPGRQRR